MSQYRSRSPGCSECSRLRTERNEQRERSEKAEKTLENLKMRCSMLMTECQGAKADRDWYWQENEEFKQRLKEAQQRYEDLKRQVQRGETPSFRTEPRKAHRGKRKSKKAIAATNGCQSAKLIEIPDADE